MVEQFFCFQPGAPYRHSVVLAFAGDVTESPDPSWRPGPEDQGSTVRWVPLRDLHPDMVHPNHWLVLQKTGVIPPE